MLLNWWYRIGSNVWVWYLTQGHIDCRHQPPTFWSLVHHFPMSALPKPHDGQHINPMSAKVIKWSAMSTFKSFPMQSAAYSMNKFMERCKAVGIERMIDLANSDMTQIVQICAAFSNHPGVSGGVAIVWVFLFLDCPAGPFMPIFICLFTLSFLRFMWK